MIFTHKVDDEVELVLRDDTFAEAYVNLLNSNYDHLKYFYPAIEKDMSEEVAKERLKECRDKFANELGTHYGILYKGQLAGEVGYNFISDIHHYCTMGYWLGKSFTGKGIAIRAMRAMLKDAFLEKNLNRVMLEIAEGNMPSRNIAVKLGFTHEGTQRNSDWVGDRYESSMTFGLLKSEYMVAIV